MSHNLIFHLAEKETLNEKENQLRAKRDADNDIVSKLTNELTETKTWLEKMISSFDHLKDIEADCGTKGKPVVKNLLDTRDSIFEKRKAFEESTKPGEIVTEDEITSATEKTQKANDALNLVDSEISQAESELSGLKKRAGWDVGPDLGMGILSTSCLEFDSPEYTYELCFFDEAHQKAKSGGSNFLGRWTGFTGKDL
jgi:chromosome segregation ATPase